MPKKPKTPKKANKLLLTRAGEAVKNEFFLESSMIISTLLETRLRILITRVEKSNPGAGFNLEQCLKRLKYLHLSGKDPILVKNIEIRLIDDLRGWKNQRNAILKDLADIHVSPRRVEKLAEDGIVLLKALTAACKLFKKEHKKPPPVQSPSA